MLRLKTLGWLDLESCDGAEAAAVVTQPKRCALLLYLALARPGAMYRRDSLLAIFWPDRDKEHARNALSQSLTFLRRNLPEDLIRTRGMEEVGLASHGFRTDVEDLMRSLEDESWAEALEIYRGDLLPGFHVSGVPEFEHWLSDERDRLRGLASRAAWALAWDQLLRGALPEAELTARRALRLDGLDEQEVTRFIAGLAVNGGRSAAVSFFERYERRLRTDLDLTPSRECRNLVEQIRTCADLADLSIPKGPRLVREGWRA